VQANMTLFQLSLKLLRLICLFCFLGKCEKSRIQNTRHRPQQETQRILQQQLAVLSPLIHLFFFYFNFVQLDFATLLARLRK